MTWAAPYKLFVVLCAASVFIWWKTLSATLRLAWSNDAYTHVLLILPISLGLTVLEWKKKSLQPMFYSPAGAALLGLASLIGLAGLQATGASHPGSEIRLAIETAAVVVWWIGSFLVCFGSRVFRNCLFPLLFLFWLVPMPSFGLSRVVELLQVGTTSVARILFTVCGVPASQNGTVLSVSGISVEVAKECSSIRSSMMLVVTSMVMAYVLLRSARNRTAVVLAALPLSILKNGLRVFTLAGLAAYVDPDVLNSRLHHQGGIVFFAAALAAIVGLIGLFALLERRHMRPTNMRVSA